jgi:flavin reductase (DIM6/NTAB) family NADH-FMN oxidoreductase RutF/DNA-binding MarR family transcriptional regulator
MLMRRRAGKTHRDEKSRPVSRTDLAHFAEEGDPQDDQRAFRRALGQFATGVAIMTARAGDQLVGVTANSFTSVSLDPPLVLWALESKAQSLPVFREARHFAVNVLSVDQVALSTRFARSSDDKFQAVDWVPGRGGVPLIKGVAAQFECIREAEHQGGDHVILIGRVDRFARFDREVLVFAHGRYGLAVDHPAIDVARRTLVETGDPHPLDDFLLPLMFRAYEQLSGAFEKHREAQGLTINQSRILACLAAHPGSSIETLSRLSFVGQATAEDAVAALLSAGLAAMRPPGVIDITAQGRARLGGIVTRARAFEVEKLAGIPAADVAALRRALTALGKEGE